MRARRVARVWGIDRAGARGRSALDRAWIRSCLCTSSTVGHSTSYCNIYVEDRDTNPNGAARAPFGDGARPTRRVASAARARDAERGVRQRRSRWTQAQDEGVGRGEGGEEATQKGQEEGKERGATRRDATRRDRANARLTTTVLRDSFSQKTRADDDDAGADEKESSARRVDARTAAERAYDDAYRRSRERKMIEDMASKSHKDKVREFNEKLSKLSEHHDIPKVGPG